MAKKESTLLNMVLTLFIVTGLASTALGFIYELTKEPIAQAKVAAKMDGINQVIPLEYDNQPGEEMYLLPTDLDSLECYPCKKDGKLVGTAIQSLTNLGFSGEIVVMVGISPDGKVLETAVLDHKETPGLGTGMMDPEFNDQFNVNPDSVDIRVSKDGGEINAITAATISSRAFSDAVKRAFDAYKKGGKNE